MNRPSPRVVRSAAVLSLGFLTALPGCLKRTISITSEPPGALVWLNDAEVGRTPVETDFTFYGNYEARLNLDGYEPVTERRAAKAPLYEYPGIDLLAEAVPTTIETTLRWHFDLTPVPEATRPREEVEAALLQRALEFRATAARSPREAEPSEQSDDQDGRRGETGEAGTPATVEPSGTDRTTTDPAPTIDP